MKEIFQELAGAKMLTALIVSVVLAVAGLVSYKLLGPNNPVEQVAESEIQTLTGDSVDLNAVASDLKIKPGKGPTASSNSIAGQGNKPAA